ncbi:RNA-binding protein 41 [Chanos chanos]|uniref:RNA-binding protein 41 n=1 Tax=Chanos chanos TaxID=29144 RepID=A0A6J2WXY1_CHACN|nr:RNA-binding protein 41 [Chanos chanos]
MCFVAVFRVGLERSVSPPPLPATDPTLRPHPSAVSIRDYAASRKAARTSSSAHHYPMLVCNLFELLYRVTRRACDDAPIPEEQETEGQRQLHSLLLQQLDTGVDVNRCVAKRQCFAPAALYKPFGEQAAGVRSLSQFQALQDGEQELASLRELGLTDAEIELWRSRDTPETAGKAGGVSVAPEVRAERLRVIQEKMEAREELLSRPQRFSASRALSRREMEIEKALFHGSDRLGFLTALYHQEEGSQDVQQGASSDPLDSLYRDFFTEAHKDSSALSHKDTASAESTVLPQPKPSDQSQPSETNRDQSKTSHINDDQSETHTDCQSKRSDQLSTHLKDTNSQPQSQEADVSKPLAVPSTITVSQPIRTLNAVCGQGLNGPLVVSGKIEEISNEDICKNRETVEGIQNIPRFQNYQRGELSNVLCVRNLSPRASLAQLVSLFSRFQRDDGEPITYRLLTGRLKGQAFITFPDVDAARAALDLVNGYRLLDKPLVIEFGRERGSEQSERVKREKHTADLRAPSQTGVQEDRRTSSTGPLTGSSCQ